MKSYHHSRDSHVIVDAHSQAPHPESLIFTPSLLLNYNVVKAKCRLCLPSFLPLSNVPIPSSLRCLVAEVLQVEYIYAKDIEHLGWHCLCKLTGCDLSVCSYHHSYAEVQYTVLYSIHIFLHAHVHVFVLMLKH